MGPITLLSLSFPLCSNWNIISADFHLFSAIEISLVGEYCAESIEEQMEKAIINRKCCNQLWFVLLISFVLCIVLLCFDYSALIGGYNPLNISLSSFVNTIDTQKPKSNSTIEPTPNTESVKSPSNGIGVEQINPLVNLGNKTDAITKQPADSCLGRYIYVHDLPSQFNEEVIKDCQSLTRGTDFNMCPYLVNLGLGPQIENPQGVLLNQSWFSTNQFLLEVIFHNKMKGYQCLTNDSSLASAIFIPFYSGLDISHYLWESNLSVRDASALDLVKWVAEKPEWRRMWGRDHFLIGGRISWDFRRQTDFKSDNGSDWGSKLMFLPESNNMTMLSIESSSWNNDFAIPYPTYFHPSKDSDILQWQSRVRNQTRSYLFSFVGAPRPELQKSIRGEVIDQCLASDGICKLLNCSTGANNCDNPVNVMRVLQDSVFCLQPPGDSYTRRSIFDSILAGCIPVFFHPGTAYVQYIWYLPKNRTKYSVFIPVSDVTDKKVSIKDILLRISNEVVLNMREEVIRLIPRIVYADPRSKLETLEDAFDIAVKGILERVEKVRRVMREGRDPSIGFAEGNDYKFTFFWKGEET